MLTDISFEYPYVLLLFFLFVICSKFCKAKAQSYYMPHLDIYEKVTPLNSTLVSSLKWLSILLAIIALASPIKELYSIHKKNNDNIEVVVVRSSVKTASPLSYDKKIQNSIKNSLHTRIAGDKRDLEKSKLIVKEYYFFYPLMFSFLFLLFFIYLKNKREN